MKWYRTDEKLPPGGKELVIQTGSAFYIAEYHPDSWSFLLKAGGYVPVKGVVWAEITPPEAK